VVFDKEDGTLLLMSAQMQDISSGGAPYSANTQNLRDPLVTPGARPAADAARR